MTHPSVTIRSATESDFPVLRTLQSALASPWPELLDLAVGDQQLGPTCLVADRDYADRDYADRDYADRDFADRDIADRDRTDRHDRDGDWGVVGYVLVLDEVNGEPASGTASTGCHVVELVVAPDARRQGIGSALLDAIADRTPAGRLWLTASAADTGAQTFYESQGFSRTGRRTDQYGIEGEPTDAVVMERQIR